MDEYTDEAFANRDEAIPIVSFDNDHLEPPSEISTPDHKKGKRERLRDHGSNLKDKLSAATRRGSDAGPSIQDRLLEKYQLSFQELGHS